ncbi:MAG: hypothetical protein IPF51_15360 [Dehalococcoidia bacterium]|uniref:hypothetical protein n=1 Tax=Candidatus Amarobacter glycogenicus TaxID=3140699 RepID=UPI0031350553|nr:hypothetical protein [Dehalococcoidia bacterium]
MRRFVLAACLPLFAFALVAGAGVVVLHNQEGRTPDASPAGEGGAEAAGSGLPRLAPESSVCQGILHVPEPGAPRVFPAEYTQRREVGGIMIVANRDVDPSALDEAAVTIERVFRNNDLGDVLAEEGAYVIVAAEDQGVLDLPEFRCLDSASTQDFFSHVCGVADRADYPVATVNELDLRGDRAGPCGGLNILYHELGHLVQGWALAPADYFDIRQFYQDAVNAGKYRRAYAATNADEYFAEATQAYFLRLDGPGKRDREWLKLYDRQIYDLLAAVYGD